LSQTLQTIEKRQVAYQNAINIVPTPIVCGYCSWLAISSVIDVAAIVAFYKFSCYSQFETQHW
jgi:hypothetical protein